MKDVNDVIELRSVDGAIGVAIIVFEDFNQGWLERCESLGVRLEQAILGQPQSETERPPHFFRHIAEIFVTAATPVDSLFVHGLELHIRTSLISKLVSVRKLHRLRASPFALSDYAKEQFMTNPSSEAGLRLPQGPAGILSYSEIYRASPLERVALIRQGLSAVAAKHILNDLHIPLRTSCLALNLSQSTVNRKAASAAALPADATERVLGVAKLIGQVENMVAESGDPEGFDAAAWLSAWLEAPLPAFGGAPPIDFMGSMEGQSLVSTALARMQSGAYA